MVALVNGLDNDEESPLGSPQNGVNGVAAGQPFVEQQRVPQQETWANIAAAATTPRSMLTAAEPTAAVGPTASIPLTAASSNGAASGSEVRLSH